MGREHTLYNLLPLGMDPVQTHVADAIPRPRQLDTRA